MKKASVICIVMLLLVALLVGCDGDAPPTQQSVETTYSICVQSASGLPLSGIRLRVYEDASKADLLCVGVTDDQGAYSFSALSGGNYVAVPEMVPASFVVDGEYAVAGESTVISLSPKKLTDAEMDFAKIVLGDAMMDFSVTDCEGNDFSLSQLLQQKKAVVLNFWYLKCQPCRMEFPYVQEAFEACGENAAFLALNPVDGDDASVAAFKEELGLTFGVAACDSRWQKIMNIKAYPTTVIIDRYGYVVAVHSGMFSESAELISALEYICSDTYQHEIFDSIAEVPSVDGK